MLHRFCCALVVRANGAVVRWACFDGNGFNSDVITWEEDVSMLAVIDYLSVSAKGSQGTSVSRDAYMLGGVVVVHQGQQDDPQSNAQ